MSFADSVYNKKRKDNSFSGVTLDNKQPKPSGNFNQQTAAPDGPVAVEEAKTRAGERSKKGYKQFLNERGALGTDGIRAMREAGKSNKRIRQMVEKADSQGVRVKQNVRAQEKYAGDTYIGDMEEGADITEYDPGAQFSMADGKYLAAQGFAIDKIKEYMEKDPDKVRAGAQRWLDRQLNKENDTPADGTGDPGSDGSGGNTAPPTSDQEDEQDTNIGNPPGTPRTPSLTDNSNTSGNAKNTGDITNETKIRNSQENNVKNDTNISFGDIGAGSVIDASVDNSNRVYGGDNRSFVYNSSNTGSQGGSGGGRGNTDTPVSMATMAGFYDVDDSPSANAAFVDRYATQNRDLQKNYNNTSHIAQKAINRMDQNSFIDTVGLDKRIAEREAYSRKKADVLYADMFGEGVLADWQRPKTPDPVEKPDFDSIYDRATDF